MNFHVLWKVRLLTSSLNPGPIVDLFGTYGVIPCVGGLVTSRTMGYIIKSILISLQSLILGTAVVRLYTHDKDHLWCYKISISRSVWMIEWTLCSLCNNKMENILFPSYKTFHQLFVDKTKLNMIRKYIWQYFINMYIAHKRKNFFIITRYHNT